MAVCLFARSVVFVLILTLILYLKPVNDLENVSKSSQSLMIALNADQLTNLSK